MSQREKVLVFWGAPPASPSFQTGNQEEQHPPESWMSVKLNWSDGRLHPETDGTNCKNSRVNDLHTGDISSVSVHEYLDLSFPNGLVSNLAPGPKPQPSPEVNCLSLSVQTEHLSMWTLSQALILKGQCSTHEGIPQNASPTQRRTSPSVSSSTPELFSPETLSPSSSQPPRVQEEGIVLEITADGLLCSQEAERPTLPPGSQHSRPSPVELKGQPFDRTNSTGSPYTLLSLCQDPTVRYTILVAVVHPCHLKEVKVKSGPSAGTLIPLASIVVTDQSNVEMKVVLWRRAAFWVLAVGPGDILMISGLGVNEDRWRGETILQSTFTSKLLNLGQATRTSCPRAPQQVHLQTLNALCGFLREQRHLLMSLPLRHSQDLTRLPYASLCSLHVNTLVHAHLRVTHCYTCTEWKQEAESRSRSALQQLAVVIVEQQGGQSGTLLLWGGATSWLQRFNTNKDTIWDVRFLLVREGSTSDRPELHSTPWSSVRARDPSDAHRQNSRGPHTHRSPSSGASLEIDLKTLLSQKFTGEVTLKVQVLWFQFQLSPQSRPQPLLDSSTLPARILEALSDDITYVGCARCGTELDTDANDIYRTCYPCLPHTSVRTFYRSAVMMLGGLDQSQVCVQVPPVAVQKILVASPQKIRTQSGSDENLQVAAEKILNLVGLPKKAFVVALQSVFLCDENNITISQEFTLLHMEDPTLT